MYLRVSLWLLASAGVLVGHVIGYAVAHPDDVDRSVALAGHAYMGPVGTILIPLGLLAVLGIAIRTVRRGRATDVPTLRHLATAQVALFLVQEVLERAAGPVAPSTVFTERGVWFGVVAQVLVAWVALRLVRFSVAVVRAVASGPKVATSAAPSLPYGTPAQRVRVESFATFLPRRRGPPHLGISVSI